MTADQIEYVKAELDLTDSEVEQIIEANGGLKNGKSVGVGCGEGRGAGGSVSQY